MECGQDLIGNGRTSLCFRNLERETETQRKAECNGKRGRERCSALFVGLMVLKDDMRTWQTREPKCNQSGT